MGWNSWNTFACRINEALVRETADAMVASGMRDAGYQYLVIDDCWQVARDGEGRILADRERFPSGMAALSAYVHAQGLKFGLYSDAGSRTCQGRPGSSGFETEDARQYAAWGVDYLKYDWCNTDGVDPRLAYRTMRDALKQSGRPVLFSLCEGGKSQPWTWARGVGHLWRTTKDIEDCYDCVNEWGGLGWTRIVDLQAGLERYAGPGGWNDPDMLEVGNRGLTVAESRAHFSFWCLLAAPLMAGNDLRSMTPEIKAILTNRDAIAIDQDPLGEQGRRIRKDGGLEVWARRLANGDRAVILFNRGQAAAEMAVSWQEIGLPYDAAVRVRDVWTKKEAAGVKGRFVATVGPHEVVMIRVEQG
jgi:alpha-galactosidase